MSGKKISLRCQCTCPETFHIVTVVFNGMVYVRVDCVQPDGCQMASVVMGMKYHCVHSCGPEGALLRCMRPIVP